MPKFLCTFTVPGPAEDMLREVGELEVIEGISPEDFDAAVSGGEYDAVIQQLSQKVDADLMSRAKVKGFANFGVGFNNFDVDAATEHGLLICEVGESERHLVRLLPELDLAWIEFKVGQMGIFAVEAAELRRHHARIAELAAAR